MWMGRRDSPIYSTAFSLCFCWLCIPETVVVVAVHRHSLARASLLNAWAWALIECIHAMQAKVSGVHLHGSPEQANNSSTGPRHAGPPGPSPRVLLCVCNHRHIVMVRPHKVPLTLWPMWTLLPFMIRFVELKVAHSQSLITTHTRPRQDRPKPALHALSLSGACRGKKRT